MTKFSANLGFLWSDLALPDAIHAAKAAGFDAVECHWPYDVPSADVSAALQATSLEMLGLNTLRGNPDIGDNGLSALPDRIQEARTAIDEALAYAVAINAANIHVMAGFSEGQAAHDTFVANLRYATELASAHDITILIEPLNGYDAPGYSLNIACLGTEPFWTFQIAADRTVTYNSLGNGAAPAATLTNTTHSQSTGMYPYTFTAFPYSGVLRSEQCNDGMSDNSFSMSLVLNAPATNGGTATIYGCCNVQP